MNRITDGDELATVAAEPNEADAQRPHKRSTSAGQSLNFTSGGHVPNSHGIVSARRREQMAVRTEREDWRETRRVLPARRQIAQLAPRRRLPQLDSVRSKRRRREQAPIGTKHQARGAIEIVVAGLKNQFRFWLCRLVLIVRRI